MQTVQDMIYERFPECFSGARDHDHVAAKKHAITAAAGIVSPSVATMRDLQDLYPNLDVPTAVIPYAIDDSFRSPVSAESILAFRKTYTGGRPFILHTGARYLHKNFVGLLAAYARWRHRGEFRLLSIGGGHFSDAEHALARGLGVQSRIDVVPHIDAAGLRTAYWAAQAHVVPSLYEGFGFPVLEALACGVPVACSGRSSLPEVGGAAPFYFDPSDGDSLLSALDEAVNEARTSVRVTRGREQAYARTWSDVAEEFTRFCGPLAR